MLRVRLVILTSCVVGIACSDPAPADPSGTSGGSADDAPSTSSGVDPSTGVQPTTDVADSSSTDGGSTTGAPEPYPDPADWGPNAGPGGPAVEFDEADLLVNCAFITGGDGDIDHHNLVVMFDGYMMMPWAPEFSTGGVSFFDISDPCDPQRVGVGYATSMRESHAVGFAQVDDRWYVVTNYKEAGLLQQTGGIGFWDITDPTAPEMVTEMELPGFLYPDAYARVTLSVFWQAPYVYVAGADNGVYVVDARDPLEPELVAQYNFEPTLRTGGIQVIGNALIVTAAEGPRTVIVDVSVPDVPQPLPGGDFDLLDSVDVAREAYFSNLAGGYMYYAVKNGGGGLLVYDIHDLSAPTYAGEFNSGGNGGYVFVKDDLAFVGESDFAGIYDVADPTTITQTAVLDLEGDLDTVTPIGNIAVLSVDEGALADQATAMAPYTTAVDTTPPRVTWSVPADGATGLVATSRVGVTMSEMVDVKSAHAGSVRVYEKDVDPALGRVDGWISVQENVINFAPSGVFSPGATYVLEIPAGGVVDYNGNAIEDAFSIEFTIAG
jgi:hypothetical protein